MGPKGRKGTADGSPKADQGPRSVPGAPKRFSRDPRGSQKVDKESARIESMQVSISNLQLNQTSNLLDKSKVVVAEKKVRRAAPNIINNTSHTRQTVMSGTNSFAVTAAKRHTNFF